LTTLARAKWPQPSAGWICRADDKGVFVMLDAAAPTRLFASLPPNTEVQRMGLAEAVELAGGFPAGLDGAMMTHTAPAIPPRPRRASSDRRPAAGRLDRAGGFIDDRVETRLAAQVEVLRQDGLTITHAPVTTGWRSGRGCRAASRHPAPPAMGHGARNSRPRPRLEPRPLRLSPRRPDPDPRTRGIAIAATACASASAIWRRFLTCGSR
jgi:hypothetical protein